MGAFRSGSLSIERKGDGTLVTDADVRTEEMLRGQLARTRPRDTVQGEEMETTGTSPRRWVIDPIDGTVNYIRGVPVWATLIALLVEDEPVMGLVAAPALHRRWWGAIGSGAYTGRSLPSATRIHVSDTSRLDHAFLSFASLESWEGQARRGFLDLATSVWRTRGYGDFLSHVLVAEGAVDLAVEPELALHDMAALAPILTEAGGRFSSTTGVDGVGGPGGLSTNGLLHEPALDLLGLRDAEPDAAEADGSHPGEAPPIDPDSPIAQG